MNKLKNLYELQSQFDKVNELKKEERCIARDYSVIEINTKKKFTEWKQLQNKVKNLKSQLKEKELEFRTLDEKRIAYQKKLFSSYAPKSPRELQELQRKIGSMEENNQILEEEILNLIDEAEKEELLLSKIDEQFDRCKEDFKKEKAFFQSRNGQIQKGIALSKSKIKEYRSKLPQNLLQEFDSAFSRGQQTGVVKVDKGACSGCHTILSERLLDSIRREPDDLHYCENCKRIIVIDDD